MGNYKIHIQGIGCHHNTNNEGDADHLARQLVIALKKAGHTINDARFTVLPDGPVTDLNEQEANPPVGQTEEPAVPAVPAVETQSGQPANGEQPPAAPETTEEPPSESPQAVS